jgi:hemerythrin-like domain-containing protein
MTDPLLPEVPDFSDPLGLLRACHERMLAQCGLLEKLVAHVAEKGVDAEARSAIARVIQYFTTSAAHHHQDEEVDLFPVLNRQSLKLADLVYRLKKDHEELDRLWAALHQSLKKGTALAQDAEFPAHVERFCAKYREHIRIENKELLTLAQHILSQRQLEDMGRAMAKRRGVRR